MFHVEIVSEISKSKEIDLVGFHGQTIYHNSEQKISVVGDSASIGLTKPGAPENNYDFKKNGDISWQPTDSGRNIVKVQNTGESDLNISGAFQIEKDPIFFTYHILVITSGVIIMGFSAVFSVRKPRGF